MNRAVKTLFACTVICTVTFFSASVSSTPSSELQRASLFNLARDFARCSAVYQHFSKHPGNATAGEVENVLNMSNGAKKVSEFIFQTIDTGKKKELEGYNALVNAYIEEETRLLESLQQDQALVKRVKKCASMSKLQSSILKDMDNSVSPSKPESTN